jgi:phosphate transport system protein
VLSRCRVRVIREVLPTAADGDAAGREDQRAVGELGFVAGGRAVATPARFVRVMQRWRCGRASNNGMREVFAGRLADLELRITGELRAAVAVLGVIGEAVSDPTAERIAGIAAGARRLRGASWAIQKDLVEITACQAPVASDLRLVLALLELAYHVGLIANQFELISEQLAELEPRAVDRYLPGERVAEMATLAGGQLDRATAAFCSRDLAGAEALDDDDDAIDRLNRLVCETTLDLEDTAEQRAFALRHVLIARSVERIGDNAVDVAEQAAFLVTRELHEFSDASHLARTRS